MPVDWAGRGGADPFANVNTLADLLALARMNQRQAAQLIHTAAN